VAVGWLLAQKLIGRRGSRASWDTGSVSGGLLTEAFRTGTGARLVFRVLDRAFGLGAGRLVGHRFLRLAHRGRRSGRIYHVVLEVIRYDPATKESIVLSGWGGRADWFRNIQTAPALEIETAGERFQPIQRFVAADELYACLRAYVDRQPLMAGVVRRTLGLAIDGSPGDLAMLEGRGYRGVAFRPSMCAS
jgi:deazaflavin-dependent oxidoreductase (nitroreductase family)